ncbi:MAG: molybdopterin-dependent oxidoreductase [Nitrospirae bacterium]|nr:molybdopterin-dependent oxidoreductase [Nitrospirota bacterium]
MKKILGVVFVIFILFVFSGVAFSSSISITGVVKQPLNLSMDDIRRFESVNARLNEVTSDKNFHGVFSYRGVPLRTLLELATVQKEESDFFKPVDMAIVIKNKEGQQTVLSWGEIFYRNPAEVLIAFSATPIMPHKECSGCHTPEVFKPWFDHLKRDVGLPKLIVSIDFYTDRSLENITSIEVIDLHPSMTSQKMKNLFSPKFVLSGSVKKQLEISDISSYPRLEALAKTTGDGKGYHGLNTYAGVPLTEIIQKAGINPDMNSVILISAPDGYRSLISYGELFYGPYGRNIIIADMAEGQPLKENGKFIALLPDDLSADRWVKAVSRIEVISLKQKPKLSIIGVGCGDTSLLTLEAVSQMAKADAFLCTEDIRNRFAKYIGNKTVLFDPLLNAEPFFRKMNPGLSDAEAKKKLEDQRAGNIQSIRDAIKAGKHVALLEYGDPTLYGSWRYWLQEFMDQIEIIPGLSAFNVSNAMIRNVLCEECKGSIILTVPKGLKANEALLKSVAESGDTLVIFIGLREMKNLMPLFRKYYPETTPVTVVYRAGYSDSERLIKTTFRDIMNITEKEEEQSLGMIYIGPCLQ